MIDESEGTYMLYPANNFLMNSKISIQPVQCCVLKEKQMVILNHEISSLRLSIEFIVK